MLTQQEPRLQPVLARYQLLRSSAGAGRGRKPAPQEISVPALTQHPSDTDDLDLSWQDRREIYAFISLGKTKTLKTL